MTKSQKAIYSVAGFILALGLILGALAIINHFNHQTAPDDVTISVDFDDDMLRIDWSKYETFQVTLTDSLEITQPGVYVLSGEIADGCVSINTNDNVKLELNNVRITNSSGPAIYVANAKNVVIFTTQGSTNELTDGANYAGYEDDEIGTIFSHDDLLLSGEGTLNITSRNEDAIVSKDDLAFSGGSYRITSADDGIRGKDSVYIQSGNFTISAGGDGIKSTNATEAERGFIYIADGIFDIVSELDAIQAETDLQIVGGTFNLKTGGGSSVASTSQSWGSWGSMPMGQPGNTASTTDTASAKGIKATNIAIEQGTFALDCSDDALHANGELKISGGDFTIATGDDGIHADNNLIIDDGKINITQSYEGIEGSTVTINDGNITLVASDDGLNAAGGSDASSMARPGANSFKADANIYIRIRGGNLQISATGDAIDSNSNICIEGGTVNINGPTNGSDNALDHDGELIITGGTVLVSEVAGLMAGGISSESTNYSVIVTFTSSYSAGTVVTIEDNNGTEVAKLTPTKTFNSITFSSPTLQKDTTYTIKVNGTVYQSFTTSSVVTQLGTRSGMNMPGGGAGDKASGARPR